MEKKTSHQLNSNSKTPYRKIRLECFPNGESAHTLSYSYICKGTLNANCQLSSNSSGKTGCTGRSYRCAWATKKGSIKTPCQTIRTWCTCENDLKTYPWRTHDVPVYVPDFARKVNWMKEYKYTIYTIYGSYGIWKAHEFGYLISHSCLEPWSTYWTLNPSTSNIHWIKIV